MPIDRGAASKAILANLGMRARRLITLAENRPLKAELRLIRSRGFSITEGEVTPGVVGLSVPILRGDQSLEGSLGLILPERRKPEVTKILPELIRARKQIESNLAVEEAAHLSLPDTAP
jgi:DNA-binding IclR family transcriptional regulator